ncbi:MAG TPA: sulfotransferase, partial [Terriglobales bacterium]|nr:sulfotransferase [Terriglobales bacterium]
MQRPASASTELRSLMGKAVHHQQRGEYSQAERVYAQILKSWPDNADAHNLMGLLAHQTQRHELAERHMQRSLQLMPKRAEFHYNYGAMLAELKRPDQAAKAFQAAVELAPRMADAWQGLAFAFLEMRLEMYAAACLQQLLQLEPRRADLWLTLGETFESIGLWPEALAALRNSEQLAPDDLRATLAISRIAVETGDDASAQAGFDQLTVKAPEVPDVHYQKGVWLANSGKFAPARAELQKALELEPDFYQAAIFYAYISELPLDHPLVQRLTQRAARGEWLEAGQGANVNFALGYVLDKHKRHDDAFAYFAEANRLLRMGTRYSTASHVEYQSSLLKNLGPEFLSRAKKFSNPSRKPLFIVGLPRSGTTLLEQILSRHPEIHGGGEMTFMHAELRRRMGPAGYGNLQNTLGTVDGTVLAQVAEMLVGYMDQIAPGKSRVTDKMPSNLTVLGLLHGLFPEAKIIYCQREPLDVCVSCFTTSFKSGHKFSNDLTELGESYRISEAAMGHWEAMFPPG